MKKISFSLFAIGVLFMTSCKTATSEESTDTVADVAASATNLDIALSAKSGSTLKGNVNFTEANNMVTMNVTVSGVKPGEHAIHIHEKPDCSAEDGSSAGGHWNPDMTNHGKWADHDGHHAGDIGNLNVDAEGNGTLTFSTDMWCIGCTDSTKNILNHSIIIHADVDDFVTQPTGNAGGRIGCAVIK